MNLDLIKLEVILLEGLILLILIVLTIGFLIALEIALADNSSRYK